MTPDRRARAVAREVLGSDIMNVHHRGEQNAPTRPGQGGSDPFRELGPMFPPEWLTTLFVPAVDVGETPSTYLLEADLPGMTENDVEVVVTGNRLT